MHCAVLHKIHFTPFEGEMSNQHVDGQKAATSQVQSASTGILGAAPRAGKRREAQ